jgi:hypothetical protein
MPNVQIGNLKPTLRLVRCHTPQDRSRGAYSGSGRGHWQHSCFGLGIRQEIIAMSAEQSEAPHIGRE